MFKFFKNQRTKKLTLAEDIQNFLNLNPANPQIDIWIDDQILFQVMRCRVFNNHDFEHKHDDFAIAHFFNKNKTYTLSAWKKFQADEQERKLIYFEEPKGIHNYLKNIGSNPELMEQEINEAIAYYELDSSRTIRVELNGY
jgi:hypothetical protein